MSQNYITIDDTLNSNACLSFYKPDLNDFKLENENNLKQQQEKFNILKEILSSEKKYLNDIKEIVEGYYEELKKISNDEFLYQIFSNIKEIYEFTKLFYNLLESSSNDEVEIANCFIKKHKSFLRLYSTYCQNYKGAFCITEKLEKENNTAKIIQKVKLKYGHCLKMATYLQLPVLRITKYHLLLQRYLKLLEKDTLAYSKILEALDLMKKVNDQINNDMPLEDIALTERISSTINMQNLVKLFGSILKQGNLIFAQTKKVHYVIVFQTMLVIRKSGSPTKILHSISNEYLAFLPKTTYANKTKYFTVIDYSQSKDDEMWEFTFKAKSIEDKQSWQSSILSCMLNGYGKKLSENVRSRVMKINSCSDTTTATATLPRKSNNEIFRKQLENIRRLTDFRGSLKNDYKTDVSSSDLTSTLNRDNFEARRRLSTPMNQNQSRFTKIFDRTINLASLTRENGSLKKLIKNTNNTKQTNQKDDFKIESIFSKFRNQDKLVSQSARSSSCTTTSTSSYKTDIDSSDMYESEKQEKSNSVENDKYSIKSLNIDSTEVSRKNSFINAFDQFETSFEEITGSLEENILSHLEISLKNEQNLDQLLIKQDNLNSNASSKSSINSEEGYYSSNHDSSSISTLTVEQTKTNMAESIDNSVCTLKSFQRTFSTPELVKEFSMSVQELETNYLESQFQNITTEKINLHSPSLSIQSNSPCQTIDINYKNSNQTTSCVNIYQKKNFSSTRNLTGKNLNASLLILSNYDRKNETVTDFNKNNNNYLNETCMKISRIKDLLNKFEENSLKNREDFKSNSFNKSINTVQSIGLEKSFVIKQSSSKLFDKNDQDKIAKILVNIDQNEHNDTEDEFVKLNVKELINKFESKTRNLKQN